MSAGEISNSSTMKSVGIDGCRSGWISVSSDMEVVRFDTISEALRYYGENCVYFIDMPIGVASKESPERTCERLMRAILEGPRKSSVFNVPCREALEASTFEEANRLNRLILGKGISKQSYFIFEKIRQVDVFLRNHDLGIININESHPEIAFHFLNGGKSMKHNKKTPEGLKERLDLLVLYDERAKTAFSDAVLRFLRKDVARDDIIDAMCLAVCASNLPNRVVNSLPQKKEVDVFGLPMAVCYSEESNTSFPKY